jgi:hypothetical protein
MSAKQLESSPAYKRAYEAAQAGGMNNTDSHEVAMEAAEKRAEYDAAENALMIAVDGYVKVQVKHGYPVNHAADFALSFAKGVAGEIKRSGKTI